MSRTRRLLLGPLVLLGAAPLWANVPPAQIQGKVSLGRNRPVVGAVILVRSETDPGPIWVTASDQFGQFRVQGIPDGTYRVVIRRDGLTRFEQSGLALKAPFRGIVEAVLAPASAPEPGSLPASAPDRSIRVSGTVTGPGGEPAVGAEIRFIRADGSIDPRDARVGAEGTVTMDELPAGRWRVEVLDPGTIPLRATVDIVDDVDLDVRLVAQPANFEVAMEDLIPRERAKAPPGFPGGR